MLIPPSSTVGTPPGAEFYGPAVEMTNRSGSMYLQAVSSTSARVTPRTMDS